MASPPLLLLLFLLFTSAAFSCKSPSLRVGLMLPEAYRKRVEPWLQLALRHVQAMSARDASFLRGHCLELAHKDTACRPSLGMKALFDLLGPSGAASDESVSALFGDICTDVNEPVAMASKNWNIVHLSFTETHAKFGTADSKELYPTFFRLVPSESNLNKARCELIKSFGWHRVGSLKQSDHSSFSLSHERLTTRLEQSGVQVIYTASLSSEHDDAAIGAELEELKRRDLHIIVADVSMELALRVLCTTFHNGLYGADFVWILPGFQTAPNGSVRRQWWRGSEGNKANCTQRELAKVLQGHFALEHVQMRPYTDEPVLVTAKTVRQVQREFRQLCAEQDARHECPTAKNAQSELAHFAYAYDGIWTLALALNQSLTDNGVVDRAALLAAMHQTSFQGLSGRVRFDDTGERLGLVQILQWNNGSYSALGYHDSAEEQFYLRKSKWWTAPLDSTIVLRRRQHVSATLAWSMCALALLGICLALAFFGVNVKHRNHRFIKMSSPNMNNLIICGSLFAYLTVFLLSIDTRLVEVRAFERICYAKTWILCTGFTLAFGSMFSKTWRVHSIFTNIRRDKKAIRDSKLYLIVAALLGVDGAVLLCWALVSPFRMAISEQGQIREQNRLVVPEYEHCVSEHSLVFQVVFFIFKGMLMLFGCFLAWETRAVNVPALNDSKYIGMSVYIVVVMCVVGLALAFILQEHLNEAYAIIVFFIIFCTTLTLCLVFVPKVIELWRTPKGTEQQRYRKGMMKSVVGKGGSVLSSMATGGSGSLRHHSHGIGGRTLTDGGQGHVSKSQQEGLHRQLSLISAQELAKRSTQLEAENLRLHQTLITKSDELWHLLERVRLLTEHLKLSDASQSGSSGGKSPPWGLGVPNGESELGRRRSARLFSSVAQQLRLRRTRTSNCL